MEVVSLDLKDKKILWELEKNSRISFGVLAKKVGLSKQTLSYRVKRLEQEGVIKNYTSIINIHALGYYTYRVYFRYKKVDEQKEKKIIEYFIKNTNVIWFVSLSGQWDLEVVFAARNFVHFNNLLKSAKENLGESFLKYNISMSPINYHLPRDYLIGKKRESFNYRYYGLEEEETRTDETDFKLMKEIGLDAGRSSVELGDKIKVSYHTVQERLKNLEEKKIVQAHTILIDAAKIGRHYYKILLNLPNTSREQEKAFYEFCSKSNFITYIVEVLGEWQIELEMEVLEENEIMSFLKELRNKFPEIIQDYSIIKVTEQHKLNYFPFEKLV